jgi:hypothetical protein
LLRNPAHLLGLNTNTGIIRQHHLKIISLSGTGYLLVRFNRVLENLLHHSYLNRRIFECAEIGVEIALLTRKHIKIVWAPTEIFRLGMIM